MKCNYCDSMNAYMFDKNSKYCPECTRWDFNAPIWSHVITVGEAEIDRRITDYKDIKATLILNYGNKGTNTPNIIDEESSLTVMLFDVLSYYEKKIILLGSKVPLEEE